MISENITIEKHFLFSFKVFCFGVVGLFSSLVLKYIHTMFEVFDGYTIDKTFWISITILSVGFAILLVAMQRMVIYAFRE